LKISRERLVARRQCAAWLRLEKPRRQSGVAPLAVAGQPVGYLPPHRIRIYADQHDDRLSATFDDAQKSLATLRALRGHRFLTDDVAAALLPVLSSYKDTTDAHLVTLAKRHGLRLATLDATLIGKSWAAGAAENPLSQTIKP
jgi:hypothetical protein